VNTDALPKGYSCSEIFDHEPELFAIWDDNFVMVVNQFEWLQRVLLSCSSLVIGMEEHIANKDINNG
jgi:hypothetical protein